MLMKERKPDEFCFQVIIRCRKKENGAFGSFPGEKIKPSLVA
jgi:hypothetical protein